MGFNMLAFTTNSPTSDQLIQQTQHLFVGQA